MSKGERMTYEELCNAVLPVIITDRGFAALFFWNKEHIFFCLHFGILNFPLLQHWSNLRKHNGERYAYSSHSQAVLDCLRNRSEWARLVDRGPKVSITFPLT